MEEWPFYPSRSFHSGKAIQPDTSVLCSNGSFRNPSCVDLGLGRIAATNEPGISFRLGNGRYDIPLYRGSSVHSVECINSDKAFGRTIDAGDKRIKMTRSRIVPINQARQVAF